MRVSGICPKEAHGYFKGDTCPKCIAEHKKSSELGSNIITNNWIKTTEFEHIDPLNPRLRFNDRQELIAACERHGSYSKAFMKPKSNGKGFEHRRRMV